LHSNLWICFGRGNSRQAAKSCSTALEAYNKLMAHPNFLEQARCSGLMAQLMVEHCDHVVVAKSLQNGFSPNEMSPGDTIIGLLYGFAINLADEAFRTILDTASEALWREAPEPKDLAEFENTALFCYLWTR
jgi:hypothetical protein